jgi:anti-sigma regulatory factor (Ser/Thr protein kinase)
MPRIDCWSVRQIADREYHHRGEGADNPGTACQSATWRARRSARGGGPGPWGSSQPQLEIRVAGQSRYLTPEAQEQLTGIGIEAINNAFQHSGATSITATAQYHRRWLRLTISDNGRGFRGGLEAVEENHFGLVGMQERAALLNAVLSIDSREGAGTTVKVTAPADSVYL